MCLPKNGLVPIRVTAVASKTNTFIQKKFIVVGHMFQEQFFAYLGVLWKSYFKASREREKISGFIGILLLL